MEITPFLGVFRLEFIELALLLSRMRFFFFPARYVYVCTKMALWPPPFPHEQNPVHTLVQNMKIGQLLKMFMPQFIFMFALALAIVIMHFYAYGPIGPWHLVFGIRKKIV